MSDFPFAVCVSQSRINQELLFVPDAGIAGLAVLADVLDTSMISTIAANIYWSKLLRGLPHVPPIFAAFEGHNNSGIGTSDSVTQDMHGVLKQALQPEGEMQKSVLHIVNDAVRTLLGSDVDVDTPLLEAGLDSLGETPNVASVCPGKYVCLISCFKYDPCRCCGTAQPVAKHFG